MGTSDNVYSECDAAVSDFADMLSEIAPKLTLLSQEQKREIFSQPDFVLLLQVHDEFLNEEIDTMKEESSKALG